MMKQFLTIGCLILVFLPSRARVLSVEIIQRDTIVHGKSWGVIGPYELIKGKVFFGTDPNSSYNRKVTDIHLAPVDQDDLVRSSADLVVLKPVHHESELALVEVSDHGGKFVPSIIFNGYGELQNPHDEAAFGDGLFLKQGFTFIWVGWQFDLPEDRTLLRFNTPVAKYPEGAPIIGLVRSDWRIDEPTQNLKLGHHTQSGYPVYDPSSQIHRLTKRVGRDAPRIDVDEQLWDFGRLDDDQIVLDHEWIHSQSGFEPGMIYELIYHSVDPPLVGLGLTAVRDIIAYAKHDSTCAFPARKGIATGFSQAGRLLRHLLYQGFNIDEEGRIAYDGMMIVGAGAGRGSFNHRFGQPSRAGSRYSTFFYPTDLFPFAGRKTMDKKHRHTDGLLNALPLPYRPKIFYVNTGYEYWNRAASLIHTTPDGKSDVKSLDNERIYHIASAQHYVDPVPTVDSPGQHQIIIGNPLQYQPNLRALLLSLKEWVHKDKDPPPSQYPTIAEEQLVSIQAIDYPNIPSFNPSHVIHNAYRADYGGNWYRGIITKQPPLLRDPFVSLAPQVDAFGNESAGIRNFELEVPLATYIPYAVRQGFRGGNGELRDYQGTFIPLPQQPNPADDRPSLETLYNNKNQYILRVRRVLDSLVDARFLLNEDIHDLCERANQYWSCTFTDPPTTGKEIKVMTFNIRYDNPGDGESAWPKRKNFAMEVMDSFSPDFLGLQEALGHQCRDVRRGLKGYRWFGVGREDGDKKGEYAPIFYKRKEWNLMKSGHFWLSPTPNEPSKGWDAALPRILTWGLFEHKNSRLQYYVFNTHFDHRGEQARYESVLLIREQIKSIAGEDPFVLMGDFNFHTQSKPYLAMTSSRTDYGIIDGRVISNEQPQGPRGTFSGFLVKDDLPLKQIDHIFVDKNSQVSSFEIVCKSRNGRYPSDHFPVVASVTPQFSE